jgi:hypothetical protein
VLAACAVETPIHSRAGIGGVYVVTAPVGRGIRYELAKSVVACGCLVKRETAGPTISRFREGSSTDQPDWRLGVCQPRQEAAARPAAAQWPRS